jgi:uncharacterized protein (TIGR02271 family)
MSNTVVALFESMDKANEVKQTLISEGMSESSIHVMGNDQYGETSTRATANESGYTDIGSGGGTGIGEKVSAFFRSLAGGDDNTHGHYAEGVNGGGALLAVDCEAQFTEQIARSLKQHGAKEIEGRGESSGFEQERVQEGTGQTAIPIVEEALIVGKREVDRGGVKVYSRIVETPVDTDVTLHNERIIVERRAVDRPATAADFASGRESTIELNAMGEEAVVSKTSRVVEEVLIGKQQTEHTEQIHDTLRKTEVEVEAIAAETLPKRS